MTASVDGLAIRRGLGRREWAPPERFGPDGWWLDRRDGTARVIASVADHGGVEWIHASMSRPTTPTYDDLCLLRKAVFGDGWSYQVFAPPRAHIDLHPTCLHLWGRLDGAPVLPDFGAHGTI